MPRSDGLHGERRAHRAVHTAAHGDDDPATPQRLADLNPKHRRDPPRFDSRVELQPVSWWTQHLACSRKRTSLPRRISGCKVRALGVNIGAAADGSARDPTYRTPRQWLPRGSAVSGRLLSRPRHTHRTAVCSPRAPRLIHAECFVVVRWFRSTRQVGLAAERRAQVVAPRRATRPRRSSARSPRARSPSW